MMGISCFSTRLIYFSNLGSQFTLLMFVQWSQALTDFATAEAVPTLRTTEIYLHWGGRSGSGKELLARNLVSSFLVSSAWFLFLQLYRINSSVCLFGISEDFRFSTYFKCASTLSNSSIFLHYFIHISHLVTCSRFFHIYRRPSTFVNINPSQFCTFFVINLYHFALYGHSLIRKI